MFSISAACFARVPIVIMSAMSRFSCATDPLPAPLTSRYTMSGHAPFVSSSHSVRLVVISSWVYSSIVCSGVVHLDDFAGRRVLVAVCMTE